MKVDHLSSADEPSRAPSPNVRAPARTVMAGDIPNKAPDVTEAATPPATEDQQPSNDGCGAPYPCRLQAIIDHTDWQPVLSALSFAMQANVKTQVKWIGNTHGHKGYVQQDRQQVSD